MSEILKAFTPQQLYTEMRDVVIGKGVGLSNFNKGSNVRAELEAISLIVSSQGFDYLDGLRKAIPIALYDGLGFAKKLSTNSSGALRFFRLPELYITYTGSDSDNQLTISSTQLTTVTSGTPGDDLTIVFATYNTVQLVINQINAHPNYTATLVSGKDGTADPSTALYQYIDRQIVGTNNYLNLTDTVDVMNASAPAVSVPASAQATVDDITVQTSASDSIPAGDATSPAVLSQSLQTESETASTVNIIANAIDTLNGKGSLNTAITGVEYVVNDSAFSGGEPEESDEDQAKRFQTEIQGLSRSTKFGIVATVLAIQGIKSVTLRENFPVAGQITVIADDGTGALSATLEAEIQKTLDGDPDDLVNYPGVRAAGITANVDAPNVIPVDVAIIIDRIGTLSDATEIQNAVQSAIEQYINTRKLGEDVITSEIIRVSKNAHPAVYDVRLTTPTANVVVDESSLARTGAGTGGTVTTTLLTLTGT